jgi:hypothetical protein
MCLIIRFVSKQCSMRYFIFLFFYFIAVSPANAQQNHFIYIQAENNQAFYVKLDKKVLSSSVSGYLIIPKLTDGTCSFFSGISQK